MKRLDFQTEEDFGCITSFNLDLDNPTEKVFIIRLYESQELFRVKVGNDQLKEFCEECLHLIDMTSGKK